MTSNFPPDPSRRRAAWALGCALVLASAGAASVARAQDCANLPNPIFGIGGSAATNLIKRLATKLAAAPEPITVVYSDPGACYAMTALVQDTPLSGTGKVWDSAGTETTCTFASGGTLLADWGAMAQEATTCQGIDRLPETIGDYKGPISGFSMIVPTASDQFSISAEALYFVYGFGPGTGHDVAPWTNPAAIASRTTTSAAGLLLAKAVGIPISRPLLHTDTRSNQGSVNFITAESAAAVATPSAALGFVSTETADANRAKVRTLAFKAVGQDCGYQPDSSATATDKRNLRDGHYFLWNVHHFFARLNEQKQIAKPALQKFIDIFTSKEPLPGDQSYIDLLIANGNVPACAMRVTRDSDMGPLASFQPAEPCGCYYESKTVGTTPSCQPCTTSAQCTGDTVCSHGFCEVK